MERGSKVKSFSAILNLLKWFEEGIIPRKEKGRLAGK